MLSQFNFEDFYNEEKLEEVTNLESFLYALLSFKKFNRTQIQKLSFLAFAEKDILVPIEFFKYNHGPFSRDLVNELDALKKDDKIQEVEVQHEWGPEGIYNLSEKVAKVIGGNQEVEKIKSLIKDLIENYGDSSAKALENHCYKNYFLKYDDQDRSEWESKVKNKINDLLILLGERIEAVSRVEELDESKRIMILSSFSYVEDLLNRLFSKMAIDQVIRGVLINKIEEYINIWGEILRLAQEEKIQQIRPLLDRSRKIFFFLNKSSEVYGVFESVFESQEIN